MIKGDEGNLRKTHLRKTHNYLTKGESHQGIQIRVKTWTFMFLCNYKCRLHIQHFLPPPKHHGFVKAIRYYKLSIAAHQRLFRTALCGPWALLDQNKHPCIGQFLLLFFKGKTHLWVSLHKTDFSMIRWCKAALNVSIIYHIFKRPKTTTALSDLLKCKCVT